MRLKLVSFLFVFMLGLIDTYAQTPIDSSLYYYNAIVNPKTTDHLPSGIKYYTDQRQEHLRNGDTLKLIRDLRMLAIGEFKIGNNFESESYIAEALSLVNAAYHSDTLINAKIGLYNQLGRIYRASLKTDQALAAFDNALKISPTAKDSTIPLNNKANIYKDQKDYENALDLYTFLFKKSKETNDSLQTALVLDNLGFVQSKMNNPNALKNLEQAFDIRRSKNYLVGMYSSLKNLTEYYRERGNFLKARPFADSALSVAKKLNSSTYTIDALSLQLSIDNNPNFLEYIKLRDSLETARQVSANKNAFAKYNVAEERKKTEENRLLQEVEKGKRIKYQSLAAFILVLLIASYFVYRYRYKKAKIEEVYKTETRISKKVHDEVANDMYRVMTDLESTPNIGPNILDQLEKIYLKTRDISRETSAIDVQTDFENDLNDMLLGYKNENVSVVTLNLKKIKWDGVSNLKKTGIYRVLQELMTNMKKHSQATSVALTFEKKDNKVAIKYSDNGVGCAIKKGNGLQNTENRIRSLNGNISFDSSPGSGFKATILV